MSFQVKDFRSITASMINWMRSVQRKITDFNVGSVVRTMLEAVAAEIDELYQQIFNGVKEAIPVSVYNSFDFSALPAAPAGGVITVTIQSSATPIVIGVGTVFSPSAGGVTYQSLQNVTILPTVTEADVAVVATSPGIAGNIPAGAAFAANPPPTGFISATNDGPFINGADVESEEARKSRFRQYIQSISRGPNASLIYGLRTAVITDTQGNVTERVAHAAVIEPWETDPLQPVGRVECYIHNGIGGTSLNLVSRAREIIYGYYDHNNNAVPGWKAAGVQVEVFAAIETGVNVTGVVTALSGYDADDLIVTAEARIDAYIQGLNLGESVILSEIIGIVMQIDGVYNFTASAPADDVTAGNNTKLMPGTITITAAP